MIMKCRDVSYCRMDESHAFADQVDEAVSLTFQTYERPKGKKPRGKKSSLSLRPHHHLLFLFLGRARICPLAPAITANPLHVHSQTKV